MKTLIKSVLTRINCLLAGVPYRTSLYVGFGAKLVGRGKYILLNKSVQIMPFSMIVSLGGGKIEIAEGATVSMYSRIASRGYIRIGRYVEMGPNCFIADFNHAYEDVSRPVKLQGNVFTPREDNSPNVEIGDGSWLGTHVAIAGNVRIGKHCVIGANSVVTKDIPDYSVAVGMLAKVIKRYNFETKQWEKVN